MLSGGVDGEKFKMLDGKQKGKRHRNLFNVRLYGCTQRISLGRYPDTETSLQVSWDMELDGGCR